MEDRSFSYLQYRAFLAAAVSDKARETIQNKTRRYNARQDETIDDKRRQEKTTPTQEKTTYDFTRQDTTRQEYKA